MKKNFLAICGLFCAALFFASCDKKEDDTSNLMIVNASPNGGSVDASANGSVIVTNLAYPSNSGYKAVASGTTNIIVTQSGTTNQILNGTLAMSADSYYTLYVIDSAHERKATYTQDDLSAPSSGKAKVRLLHLSPNSPNVDVTINGNSSAAFNSRGYNDIASNASFFNFTEVDAAGLNLQVKLTGTSTVLATIPTINLQAGKIYTLIIRGFSGGTGTQALGVEVITHN